MGSLLVTASLLRNIPLFKSLSENDIKNILSAPENGIEKYDANSMIIRELEIGHCMYVILDGLLEVMISGGSMMQPAGIAKLKAGDFFGEQALLPWGSGRRNASIRTKTATTVFRIDKKYVLLSIGQEEDDKYDMTSFDDRLVFDAAQALIGKMALFKNLSKKELSTLKNWTEIVDLSPGAFVMKKFQKGEHLYVILKGSVQVFTLNEDGDAVTLAKFGAGQFVGEQAIMPGNKGKRSAFVKAMSATKMLKIPKQSFRLLLSRDKRIIRKLHEIQKQRQLQEGRLLQRKSSS